MEEKRYILSIENDETEEFLEFEYDDLETAKKVARDEAEYADENTCIQLWDNVAEDSVDIWED